VQVRLPLIAARFIREGAMTDSKKERNLLPFRRLTRFGARHSPSAALRSARIRRFVVDAALLVKGHAIPRSRLAIVVMACVVAVVPVSAFWSSKRVGRGTNGVGAESLQPEIKQAAGGENYLQMAHLIGTLISHETNAQVPGDRYREEDFIRQEIGSLMKEFGAEECNVLPEFVAEVDGFVRLFQDRDRDLIVCALVDKRDVLEHMRAILRRDHMPEDLAYMALVESGFEQSSASQEGAAGFWQFTEETARDYGMEVNDHVDERLDLSKSTEAASRYIRDLILEFGSGSSVMLAMAAYNSGPETVRRAVRSVKDPIKQRNFWYLYHVRALPEETRLYVPRVFAAILIGRNPKRFGF
jgi:hypothetical protein